MFFAGLYVKICTDTDYRKMCYVLVLVSGYILYIH